MPTISQGEVASWLAAVPVSVVYVAAGINLNMPIVGPILLAMGLDPIWLGIMIAINLQTSFLTPPFGFALFYLRGVAPAELPTSAIYRGVIPFIIIQLMVLVALWIWPAIATWLPQVMKT